MRRALLATLLLLGAAAMPAAAQERRCDLVESGRIERNDAAGILTFFDPFFFRCTDGTELRASSGTLDSYSRDLVLDGDVFFEDPEQSLTADHATYNSLSGRLYATGDVVFTNRAEGSTIRGPELEYYRATAERPEANVNARQRPHLTLQPRERGEDAEPLELDADQVSILGQDLLNATGDVVITRTDLRATAAEAQYNAVSGALELRGQGRIVSKEYTLGGEVIQARLADGVLEHVHSRSNASVKGSDLQVTSPDLQLFFADELLQRAVARTDERGASDDALRAVATSGTFRLAADSIDALLPGQKLQTVLAIGGARGESVDTTAAATGAADSLAADSLAAEPAGRRLAAVDTVVADSLAADSMVVAAAGLVDRDWIVGDTITGFFETPDSAAAPGDTAVVLRRIVARGGAQSLYRIAQENAPPGAKRGVNFLSGDVIELNFAAGELQVAEVTGLRRGVYLDPTPPAADAPPGGTAPPTPVPTPTPVPGGGR